MLLVLDLVFYNSQPNFCFKFENTFTIIIIIRAINFLLKYYLFCEWYSQTLIHSSPKSTQSAFSVTNQFMHEFKILVIFPVSACFAIKVCLMHWYFYMLAEWVREAN